MRDEKECVELNGKLEKLHTELQSLRGVRECYDNDCQTLDRKLGMKIYMVIVIS
jgi:hypothetical protein